MAGRSHNMTEPEALTLVPPSKSKQTNTKKRQARINDPKPKKVTWKYPVSRCSSKSLFAAARDRRKHLIVFVITLGSAFTGQFTEHGPKSGGSTSTGEDVEVVVADLHYKDMKYIYLVPDNMAQEKPSPR